MKKLSCLISIGLSSLLLTGCFEANLPKCDDKETKLLLSQIFERDLPKTVRYIETKNIQEKGFNKKTQIRVCSANVILSDNSETAFSYNIFWENKKTSRFLVQIVNVDQ